MGTWTAIKLVVSLLIVGGIAAAIGWPNIQLSRERAAHSKTKESYAAAQLAAEQDARRRENEMQKAVSESRRSLDEARTAIKAKDSALYRARVDVKRLRDQLTSSGNVPGPTCPACICPTVAQVAGEGVGLLERGRELLRACARDNDERAAELTATLRAWPGR